MKRAITLLLLLLALYFPVVISADVIKDTYTYAVKDSVELRLDKYVVNDSIKNKPCIIFLFGGGFVGGKRDRTDYLPYFHSLAENGNVVVSMDYRLGMKKMDLGIIDKADFSELAKKVMPLFLNTLSIATEDLVDVIKFILDNREEWNIDCSKIIVSGSSAGAITALHGEYAICNKMEIVEKLPDDFRYAAVISMAGAIFSINGDLVWSEKPAPCLFFHGSADKNVPYDASVFGNVGFYGAKYIVDQLDRMRVPYYFYDEEYGTHSLASSPMKDKLSIINAFIKDEIVNMKGQRIHSVVKFNDRKEADTDFSLLQYLLFNFKH